MNNGSPSFSLNLDDLKKLGIGAGVAAGGAALTYLASNIGNVNFGVYTPIIVALFSVFVNTARKFLADHS